MTSSSEGGAVGSFSFSPGCQVIDSIMALFRVDFSGRGELAERQQKLAQMLSRLQKISEGVIMWRIYLAQTLWHQINTSFITMAMFLGLAVCVCVLSEYNVAVFITNQMTADPGAGMT